MKQLVLITGASGQLGKAMTEQLVPRHEVVSLGRAELDVSNGNAALATIAAICPDVIVNCSAYTNVDGAETDPGAALAANAWGVKTLARAAADINATLVHFSTDFVFDGSSERPYREDDGPNPRGTYAVSKLLGEWFAAEAPAWYVLRVESLFGGPNARSSVDRIIGHLESNREVVAFSDRTVSPSYVDDVVHATSALIEMSAPSGLYHCVNTGWTTWSGLARELAVIVGKPDAPIRDITMSEAGLLASRPKFAALSNEKLTGLGIAMPTWQSALRRYVETRPSAPDL
ncbi:MAG TPA: dTDP-4-dehydrorhamnose reductase [Vicinamibacterales bacterium]|nr:dTDP-4-dehydrorhamnose reductase [Vicinamibacterales bacterium]